MLSKVISRLGKKENQCTGRQSVLSYPFKLDPAKICCRTELPGQNLSARPFVISPRSCKPASITLNIQPAFGRTSISLGEQIGYPTRPISPYELAACYCRERAASQMI